MHPITTILLNKENDPDKAIESIMTLRPHQVLLGTFSPIKSKFKEVGVIELKKDLPYNKALNELVNLAKTDWILYIKDNESLVQFDEYVPTLLTTPKDIYGFQIMQEDVVIKEARFWNKTENQIVFKNPVFEKLNAEPTRIINAILYQQQVSDPKINTILESWKKSQPFSTEACYYKAFAALAQKNFKDFSLLITNYLFHARVNDMPTVMARYYLALVQGIVQNESREAIQNIILCLAENPLMAEFWCLLGDIFVKKEKFKDAMVFYDNALILGSQRLNLDVWPMQISKYNDYPKEMVEKCKQVLASASQYRSSV